MQRIGSGKANSASCTACMAQGLQAASHLATEDCRCGDCTCSWCRLTTIQAEGKEVWELESMVPMTAESLDSFIYCRPGIFRCCLKKNVPSIELRGFVPPLLYRSWLFVCMAIHVSDALGL